MIIFNPTKKLLEMSSIYFTFLDRFRIPPQNLCIKLNLIIYSKYYIRYFNSLTSKFTTFLKHTIYII